MARGDHLTHAERTDLEEVVRQAELLCRAEFSIFVGDAGRDPHAFATQLHNSLVAPAHSVVVMVDPRQKVVEVVTGGWVRRTLSDRSAQLAVAAMQSAFAAGDLAGGLRRGVQLLAEHARAPQSLHEDRGAS